MCFPLVFPYEVLAVHSSDKLLHPCGAGLFHLLRYMAINVQGKGCGGVAQILLHRLDIVPGLDGCHGVRVPQIVKAGFRAAYLLHDLLEGVVHGGSRQVVAQIVREYKAAVLPALAISQPVLHLLKLHPAQSSRHRGGYADRAPLAILCGYNLV